MAFFADTTYSVLNAEQQLYPYDYPDQSLGTPGRALKLINAEGAELALHGGDIGYDEFGTSTPEKWDLSVTQVLGADFPLFASAGNHDRRHWDTSPAGQGFLGLGYNDVLTNRYLAAEANPETGLHLDCTFDSADPVDSIGRRSTCTYKNITFVTIDAGQWISPTQLGQADNQTEAYLRTSLEAATTPWVICNWHYNQTIFQTGFKSNQAGWKPYEYCRDNGAIIGTGHEHAYSRTHLMTHFGEDTTPGDIATTGPNLVIDEGQTVAWVSGLGGISIRNPSSQVNNPWWAKTITANDQNNTQRSGAVFCDFQIDGNSNAVCYFKMVDGVVYDRFELVSNTNEATGTFTTPYVETNSPPFAPPVATQDAYTRVPLSLSLTAQDADGPEPVEFWSVTLPPGLSLNRDTGEISGTPSGPAQMTTKVFVWDGVHSVEIPIEWNIEQAPIAFTPTITSDCLAGNGRVVLDLVNNGPVTEVVDATITGLAARTLSIAPGASGRFTWTGRADRFYSVEALARFDGTVIASETVVVQCDPPVAYSCLAGNGRIDVNVLNDDTLSHIYSAKFGRLSPRVKLVPALDGHRFTITGRRDGPIDVLVLRDGQPLLNETVEIDCDPDPPGTGAAATITESCLAGNGRIDVQLRNNGSGDGVFATTFGALPPRIRTLSPGATTRVTVTGRADGPISVLVSRNSVLVFQQVVVVDCD